MNPGTEVKELHWHELKWPFRKRWQALEISRMVALPFSSKKSEAHATTKGSRCSFSFSFYSSFSSSSSSCSFLLSCCVFSYYKKSVPFFDGPVRSQIGRWLLSRSQEERRPLPEVKGEMKTEEERAILGLDRSGCILFGGWDFWTKIKTYCIFSHFWIFLGYFSKNKMHFFFKRTIDIRVMTHWLLELRILLQDKTSQISKVVGNQEAEEGRS